MTNSFRTLIFFMALPAGVFAAAAKSDIQPPLKRQATVTTAERLANRAVLPPLPEDLASPFNPPGFDKPEVSESDASQVAATPTAAPPPPGDREILESLAAQLMPTGTITSFDGMPLLIMGSKRFQIGTRFTVTYNNQDYELELVAIDRTTFTLRYRGEQITRPIKSVR
jgi:hypothetical protein